MFWLMSSRNCLAQQGSPRKKPADRSDALGATPQLSWTEGWLPRSSSGRRRSALHSPARNLRKNERYQKWQGIYDVNSLIELAAKLQREQREAHNGAKYESGIVPLIVNAKWAADVERLRSIMSSLSTLRQTLSLSPIISSHSVRDATFSLVTSRTSKESISMSKRT